MSAVRSERLVVRVGVGKQQTRRILLEEVNPAVHLAPSAVVGGRFGAN